MIDLENYTLTRIESVTLNKKEHVYDIEVDSEDHAFIAKSIDGAVGISHNSALISLSNLTDVRMRDAKSGEWWHQNQQRALANNSVCYTETPDMGIFMEEWKSLYESKSGERGIFNRAAADHLLPERRREMGYVGGWGTNPCSEIILRSAQFCNLTEAIIRPEDTIDTLSEKIRLAAILGTFQSTLTNFRYIRNVWKTNCEDERLLGVSLTGILDHFVMGDHELCGDWLNILKEVAVNTNKKYAKMLKINQSSSVTCTKPSGCTVLETKVRTVDGDLSMNDIFDEYSDIDISEFIDVSDVWVKLTKPLFVYDENNSVQEVTKLYINGLSDVYEINDSDNNLYTFTGNHKLKTKDGWKRVDGITDSDIIVSY